MCALVERGDLKKDLKEMREVWPSRYLEKECFRPGNRKRKDPSAGLGAAKRVVLLDQYKV